MTLGARPRARLAVIVVVCAAWGPSVRAADDLATWMHTLRAGGMQPAEEAVTALARAGEAAVRPLAELLADGTPLERRRACVALGGMSTSVAAALEALVKASADPDVEVRLAAVQGLTRWAATRPGAREALAARLGDADVGVRVRAASGLVSADETYADLAEPALVAALRGDSLAPRLTALSAFARLATHASATAVETVTAALADPLAPVRGAAVVALAAQRPLDAATVRALCPRLADPDPWVAMGTARALATLDAPVAVCAAGLLDSADPTTSRWTAWLLHARAPRERAAAEAIAARAADPDPVVRDYARSAAWLLESRDRSAEPRAGGDD